jgi:DNA polymerase sigma
VHIVRQYLEENEVIEPLILVIKHMVKVWGYNNPYTGGLGSYAMFLMVVSFLQQRKLPHELSQVNLGRTLLEFLDYYWQFDSKTYGIACCRPGKPGERANVFQADTVFLSYLFQGSAPLIEDPINQQNNVAKSAFNFDKIKEIFRTTYNLAFLGCFCECHETAVAHSHLQAQGSLNSLNQRIENIASPFLNQGDYAHQMPGQIGSSSFLSHELRGN